MGNGYNSVLEYKNVKMGDFVEHISRWARPSPDDEMISGIFLLLTFICPLGLIDSAYASMITN